MLEILFIVNKFSAFNKFLAKSGRKISFKKNSCRQGAIYSKKITVSMFVVMKESSTVAY